MKRIIVLYIIILKTICGNLVAGDIKNPIDIYVHPYRIVNALDSRSDSIYAGSIELVQLPEYNERTQILVKHICWFETNKGFVFLCAKNSETDYAVENYAIEFPGQYHVGDTISAVFEITPIRVGHFSLGISVFEIPDDSWSNSPNSRTRIGESINLAFRLGSDGRTEAIASEKCDTGYISPFGISSELIRDSIVFFKDPKPLVHEYSKPAREAISNRIGKYFFSIKVVIKLNSEFNDELEIKCYVSPYHNFEKGIGFMIMHPVNANVSDCSPSISGAVDSSKTYEFSAKLKFTKSGVNQVSIMLTTMNSDYGKEGGIFSYLKDIYQLASGLRLFIGIDNNSIFFISEKNPFHSLSRPENFKAPLPSIDSRFQIIEELTFWTDDAKTRGAGYNQVIVDPSLKKPIEE